MGTRVTVGAATFDVPDRVLLDASFLLAVRVPSEKHHAEAAVFFARLAQAAYGGHVALYVSPRVIDEVWWGMARLLWDDRRGPGAWRRLRKADRKGIFQRCATELRAFTGHLTSGPWVNVTDILPSDVSAALALLTSPSCPLEPADAFHVAVTDRLGVTGIVTSDPDFAGLGRLCCLHYDKVPPGYV